MPTGFAFSPAAVSSETAWSRSRPTTLGTITFFGPVETVIVTKLPRSVRSPGCGILGEDLPDRDVGVVGALDELLEPGLLDLLHGEPLDAADDVGDGDGLGGAQLRLHLLPGEPAADEGERDDEHAEEPRPDRAAPRRLVVLVVAARRVGRAPAAAGRRDGSSSPPRPRPCARAPSSPPRPSPRRRRSRGRSARGRSPSPRRSGSGRPDPSRARAARRSRGRVGSRRGATRAGREPARGASSRSRPASRR